MKIKCEKINRTLIIKLFGEIDHNYAENVRNKIDLEFEKINGKDIIFDFSEVSFMDSSGICMIIGRYKNIKSRYGQVYAINLTQNIKRIFDISGLKKLIKCFENKQDAINHIIGR